MICAIYARVSTSEQARGYSIEAQLSPCRDYARLNGWTVYGEYVDPGHSGGTDKRPAFKKMISDALSGHISVILCHKFDRFARSRIHSATYKSLLRDKGIQVISVTQPLEADNPASMLLEGITEVFDEWFLVNLRAETLKGQWRAIEEGKFPHQPPLGYIKHNGNIEMVEVGAMLSQAFSEFASGQYTLYTWSETAYQLGIRGRRGNKLSPSDWSTIFRNRFYVGVLCWAGREAVGNHQPLVSQDIFDRVQAVLLANRNHSVVKQYRSYLLSHLLWSENTGSPMHGTTAKVKHVYYRSHLRAGKGYHSVPAARLHEQIEAVLSQVTVDPAGLDSIDDLDDTMRLALKVAPHVGAIYQWLPSEDQRRALCLLVIERQGLKVMDQTIVKVQARSPFCCGLEWGLAPAHRLQLSPAYFLLSVAA